LCKILKYIIKQKMSRPTTKTNLITAAARAAQTENGGENAGKSGANAKPLSGLAKRRKQPERYAKYHEIDTNIECKYNNRG
jgi:hypothetical protein